MKLPSSLAVLILVMAVMPARATPPFVQNGTVVTTPGATGTYNGATFSDNTTAYQVTVSPAPGAQTTLNNTASVIDVGDGSNIFIAPGSTLNDTGTGSTVQITTGGGTIVNAGTVTNTDPGADEEDLYIQNLNGAAATIVNNGTLTGNFEDIQISGMSSASNIIINNGTATSTEEDSIYVTGTDATLNYIRNTGTATAGDYGIELFGTGATANIINNSGVVSGDTAAIFLTGTGAGSNTVTNSGEISGTGIGIDVVGTTTGGNNTVNLIGGSEASTTAAVEFTTGTNNIVNVIGRNLTNGDGLTNLSATTGVLNLNIVGITPAEKAQVDALEAAGATSGTINLGRYSYTFTNLLLTGNAISLEESVDPGLLGAARAIDNVSQNLPLAYDPFYVAAASDPEAALNELVGREIDNAIDITGVNQGTQLAYQVNNHLDSLSRIGGFDLSDFHVSTASELAFADTGAQLDSILQGSRFGGTEMSTDAAKDMKDTKQTSTVSEGPRWGAWAAGTVTIADQSSGTIPGYHATTGSPTLGVDYRVSPAVRVGALINYSTTGADFGDGSRLGVETGLLGVYGRWQQDKWHVDGFAAGGYSSYDINRNTFGGAALAHPNGTQVVADSTGGYDFGLGRGWTATPELGLTYTYVGVQAYTEGNAGAFDLSKGTQDIDSLRSHLGGRLSNSFTSGGVTYTLQLQAAYYHEFMDGSRGVSTSLPGAAALGAFAVNTQSPERDFALAGLGFDAAFTEFNLPMGAFINYDAQVGQSDYVAHNIDAGFRVSF